jgi:hypothetical protein
MNNNIALLVTFGRGGDTVYCSDRYISGYGSPENPHAAAPNEGKIFPDGTPAIDVCKAVETNIGFRYAISGPLLDVNLHDGEINECPDPSPIFASAVKLIGPLDSVGIVDYIRGWKEHGARIGAYKNNRIIWED